MITIGIVGNGFLGKATSILSCSSVQYKVYDINPEMCIPKCCTLDYLSDCSVIFVCVPTPMNLDGSCNTSIVDDVICNIRQHIYKPNIIVRSTVPIGYCKSRGVHFMPEFLTEANWREDFVNTERWILGINENLPTIELKEVLQTIFLEASEENHIKSSTIEWMNTGEAEAVKYFRNCFLAAKVSFCNEFKYFCDKVDVNYSNVMKGVVFDERIGKSHTSVPGPDGLGGYSGHCLVKDINSLSVQMRKAGCNAIMCNASINRNELIDRPNRDWYSDKYKGRVFFERPN